MKTAIQNILAALLVAVSTQAHAQGTLVYDQQSATGAVSVVGNGNADGLDIQEDSPLMQSFIPTLSAIGFVQFELADIPGNGNNGATVYVNLWTGSTRTNTATFLGSTTPVYMPNGFVNSGLGVAGVTNFYFSTPISLTAGQTYYLQPVVLSGDDPWDIITIGDTYPNGQLFGKTGGYFQPSTDFWFREGVVPEPTTLALFGLSGILAYAFKRRSKLLVLCGVGVLFLGSTYAQTTSVQSAPDSVVQATADAAGLTPVSAAALPRAGTFWVMTTSFDGRLIGLPYPGLPPNLSALPIYSVTANTFLVDDTGGQVFSRSSGARMSSAMISSTLTLQSQEVASLIEQIQFSGIYPPGVGSNGNGGFQSNYTPPVYTNGLWLETLNADPTNLWLRLHGTIVDDLYQLLSTTNLLNTNWDLGEILWDVDDDPWDFSPVPKTNTMTFYRAHHANPVMQIWNVQDSEELNPTNTSDPGHTGIIGIQNGDEAHPPATNDLTVYYTVSGTAQSGIDYSNLPGVLTIPAGQWSANIVIQPTADGLKPDQTIILTLVQNTNYLIDPDYASATNTLFANPEVYPIANGDKKYPCPNTSLSFYLQAQDPNNLPLTYSVLTWPTNGTLDTNALPSVTYTPNNCYEGLDSFTFTASDGQFTSAPATVTLIVSSQVYADSVSAQTCRGTPVGVTLSGAAGCGETWSYAVLSNPAHGTLSGTAPDLTYSPGNMNFTGTDSFNFQVTDECGYSATGVASITVGGAEITPNSQAVMTGTNRPVAITLSASDYDSCNDDTNYYTYTIVSGPTHGTLSGTPPNVTYTPTNCYEGVDSFQFTVGDGVWTSTNSAIVTNYVVAGPNLVIGCNPFGTGPFVQLDWYLDNTVQQMEQQYNFISDYKIYRSSVSGGPYTCIYTNTDLSLMSYMDTNVVAGQTNYYVATFEFTDNGSGKTYESPHSNEIVATSQNPNDLIAPDAVWDVTDISSNHPPLWKGDLRAPFSSEYPNQYPNLYPLPNTLWLAASNGVDSIWSNNIVLVIPTNMEPSQVKYSIAIDNDYWLYVNGSNVDTLIHEGGATWASFKTLATNVLHQGTNNIGVVIRDRGNITYFSMVVTTNTCDQ